jgi:copper chaperone CopZ
MNKNTLLPVTIIIAALFIGGAVVLSGQNKSSDSGINQPLPDNLRVLTLSIPNMICAGCAASIEGYVNSMPGVYDGSVSLVTKSGIFFYDPSKVSKEQIVKNTIFDIYAPIIASDEQYDPARHQLSKANARPVPIAIQQKSIQVSQLLREKNVDIEQIQTRLDQVDTFLQEGRNQEAENLLDEIIKELENL